jgi:hypothetical protein
MPKYRLTQRRVLTQQGTVEITLKDGVSPMEWLAGRRAAGKDPMKYVDAETSELSIHVELAVAEE